MRLINVDKVIEFPYSSHSNTVKIIDDWIAETCCEDMVSKHKTELNNLCWKAVEGMINVVKTSPTITPKVAKEKPTRKKVMISQPMRNLSKEAISKKRRKYATLLHNAGFEIVDTYFSEEFNNKKVLEEKKIVKPSVYFLGKAIEKMGECDTVFFAKGWEDSIGCSIEHLVAVSYDLECIYE